MKGKKIIGRIENIDLPELGLYNIQAKTDTGAETSVLHCEDMEVVKQNGHLYIVAHDQMNTHKTH